MTPDLNDLPSTVVELRPYFTRAGRRDDFNAIFNRLQPDLVKAGQHIHAKFRVVGAPDRFVWLRGFDDMDQRTRALSAFYDGPVWKANRDAVNATLADIGEVRLLKPVDDAKFTFARKLTAFMVATTYLLNAPADAGFLRHYREVVKPALAAAGATPVSALATHAATNPYPRVPYREGENAFVWFAAFANAAEYRSAQPRIEEVERGIAGHLASPPQRLELVPATYSYSTTVTGGVHDFDFIDGRWSVANRRLRQRGVFGDDWDTFPGTQKASVLMGGVTNVDEVAFPTRGWSGTTFRHFDLEKKQWSIYWVNNRDGRMQSPVVGGFDGDVGHFYGEDTDEGKPIKVVYRWTRHGPDKARWEQAFSYDGGQSWETNWISEHTRIK